jgi:Lon protease-like protein
MKTQKLHLPVFPLPVFLLPEGVTRLRIFEPRYLKMLRVATQGQGFIILLNDKEQQTVTNMWGSWVEIINFDKGEDDVLEVDVMCKSLVELHSIDTGVDGLPYADATYLEHWPDAKIDSSKDELSTSLSKVFENNMMLNELYAQQKNSSLTWVVARWLELLPMNQNSKNKFVDKTSFVQAKEFVKSIIYK